MAVASTYRLGSGVSKEVPAAAGRSVHSLHLSPVRQPFTHGPGRLIRTKCLGVEFASDPFQQSLVLRMFPVGQSCQEFFVAPYASDIFRRAGPLAFQAQRVTRAGVL